MANPRHYVPHETNLDTLSCWEEHVGADEFDPSSNANNNSSTIIKSPDLLLESDMLWEEQELTSLLGMEQHNPLSICLQANPALETARRQAVEWILRVNFHYSFSALTALLAVNYFDRFLFSHSRNANVIPWITQLAAVACLSLAAKVHETQVPLLVDLQVEECKYLFEGKTIKRMEILVLSILEWKMNPPTPLSFLDYITRRLGSKKDHLCWEFLSNCQTFILSILPDSRLMSYLPSELASATMMHVVNGVKPGLEAEYQRQLFSILGIDKEKVKECGKMMLELWSGYEEEGCMKRKFGRVPGSPNGVMDVSFSCDSSNDSWAEAAASVSSSPEHLSKKRTQEQLLPSTS